jgi:hypothetical protein
MRNLKHAASLLAVTVFLGLTGPARAYGQFGIPSTVLDPWNLLQAIDTLYATYDEIMQMVEQVQNTYQQLQRQIEMVRTLDFNDIAATFRDMDPSSLEGIIAMRGQLRDAGRYDNRNMNLINAVQDTLTRKSVSIGGKSYSWAGLFGIGTKPGDRTTIFDLPLNIAGYVVEQARETAAGYTGDMSYRQRESLAGRYGLSPGNFRTIEFAREVTRDVTDSVTQQFLSLATGEGLQAALEEAHQNQKVISDLMEGAGDSMVAQQQATTHGLIGIMQGVTNLALGLNRYTGWVAGQEVQQQVREELEAEARGLRQSQWEARRRETWAFNEWW